MKKYVNDESLTENKGRFIKFFRRNGFYLVLLSCIIIVTVTAFLVTRYNLNYYSKIEEIDDNIPAEIVGKEETIQVGSVPETSIDTLDDQGVAVIEHMDKSHQENIAYTNKDQDYNTEPKIPNHIESQEGKKEAPKEIVGETIKFMWPVNGEIILDFANNRLIYSKTLKDWRTHMGIDIKGDMGTQVKAAADGVIERVYTDEGLGISIIIDHNNGIKTKYSNLSTDSMVKAKQNIKQGDVISGIGESALFEIGEQAHLHFEIIENDINVDPKVFLPK